MVPLKALSVEEARALLPCVGDVRYENMTLDKLRFSYQNTEPLRCVVIYVNPEHLYYTVQFRNGFRESFKVPRTEL